MQEFILTLVIAFVLFRVLREVFSESMYRSVTGRMKRDAEQKENHTYHNEKRKVKITYTKPPTKDKDNDNGEYVDWEEVK